MVGAHRIELRCHQATGLQPVECPSLTTPEINPHGSDAPQGTLFGESHSRAGRRQPGSPPSLDPANPADVDVRWSGTSESNRAWTSHALCRRT
jgi:hypothetical protein